MFYRALERLLYNTEWFFISFPHFLHTIHSLATVYECKRVYLWVCVWLQVILTGTTLLTAPYLVLLNNLFTSWKLYCYWLHAFTRTHSTPARLTALLYATIASWAAEADKLVNTQYELEHWSEIHSTFRWTLKILNCSQQNQASLLIIKCNYCCKGRF